jgi:acyl-CoA dehydrogenase
MTRTLLPEILTGDERGALRHTVDAYLDEALPWRRVADLDEADAFPGDVWSGLGEIGVLGLGIPEEFGGSGGSAGDSMVVCIEIARRYPSLAVDYVLCGMVARMLVDHGTEEQRERWLPGMASGETIHAYGISEPDGGTDALALRTRAVPEGDGWRVDGSKLWISMAGEADVIFTLLRTDAPDPPDRPARGISVLAVPTGQDGVTVRRVHLAGMRGAGTCEVTFDGARAEGDGLVGPRGRGFHMLRETLNVERLLSAAISIGIGTAALEGALDYAAEREAFGRPIGGFQAIQHPLVDAAVALGGGMLLTERALERYEAGEDATAASGMAKLAVAEATAQVVDRGVRALGGMGLAREAPMQMWFRDARLQLFSPVSNEMVRNLVAEAMGLPRSY